MKEKKRERWMNVLEVQADSPSGRDEGLGMRLGIRRKQVSDTHIISAHI